VSVKLTRYYLEHLSRGSRINFVLIKYSLQRKKLLRRRSQKRIHLKERRKRKRRRRAKKRRSKCTLNTNITSLKPVARKS
jgi:hypothetical protein